MSIELLMIIIVAPIILIESREILLGLLSMPICTAFILIYLGVEPRFVLITATLVQLYYHRRISSGSVRFPEYGFGFWIVTGIGGLIFSKNVQSSILASFTAFLIIVLVAKLSAFLLQYKRKLLEITTDKILLLRKNSILQLFYSLTLSYFIFLTATISFYFLILFVKEFIRCRF